MFALLAMVPRRWVETDVIGSDTASWSSYVGQRLRPVPGAQVDGSVLMEQLVGEDEIAPLSPSLKCRPAEFFEALFIR